MTSLVGSLRARTQMPASLSAAAAVRRLWPLLFDFKAEQCSIRGEEQPEPDEYCG
jgi:hypothetical protein